MATTSSVATSSSVVRTTVTWLEIFWSSTSLGIGSHRWSSVHPFESLLRNPTGSAGAQSSTTMRDVRCKRRASIHNEKRRYKAYNIILSLLQKANTRHLSDHNFHRYNGTYDGINYPSKVVGMLSKKRRLGDRIIRRRDIFQILLRLSDFVPHGFFG